ncbi:MAG: short-chain dehydrogenase/reductase, partial [Actinomycetia bacterium]|nr:short-chain dehydrogenase/reductase [Actinomycetes bacterium]
PMHTLQAKDVADAVVFLDALDPSVVVPEILIRAAEEGPLAPDPVLPEGYKAKSGD